MALCLQEVYKKALPAYKIKLIAGKKGLRNIVEWVHVIEDEQVSGFLSGNELVFTTGIGHSDSSWLTGFVRGLKENHACGLVVNLGRYIHEIPQQAVDFCKKQDFPLFTIPWPTKIVDMTRYICHMIIEKEKTEISVSNAFYNAIFSAGNTGAYRPQLERYGFPPDGNYRIALACIETEDPNLLKRLGHDADGMLSRYGKKYNVSILNNNLLIIYENFSSKMILESLKNILRSHSAPVFIGLSGECRQVSQLRKYYKQAGSSLKIALKNGRKIVGYSDLGIYKLLLLIDDQDALQDFRREVLGKLYDYDRMNGTDYVTVLRHYLEQNGSVQSVANLMYVHRNTINYKLKKISGIVGCNLAQEENRVRMILAYKIADLL